jgi:hypothetical protein
VSNQTLYQAGSGIVDYLGSVLGRICSADPPGGQDGSKLKPAKNDKLAVDFTHVSDLSGVVKLGLIGEHDRSFLAHLDQHEYATMLSQCLFPCLALLGFGVGLVV